MHTFAMEVAALNFIWDLIVFIGLVGMLCGIYYFVNKVDDDTIAAQAVEAKN